jgi:hypothetical protein
MEELTPVGITVSAGNITGIGGTLGTVDNAVPRADGTGGVTAQGSDIVIDDATTSTQNNVAITNQHSGQTNSALVLTPKGTGAFILGSKPDGTAVGGNARGTNAVDLQTSRTTATQVVSGAGSFAAGINNTVTNGGAIGNGNSAGGGFASFAAGSSCNASGSNSVAMGRSTTASGGSSLSVGGFCSASAEGAVALGNNTTASASGAFAIGSRSVANRYGMIAFCPETFSVTASGDAQGAIFVLRNKTTNATATELFLETPSTRLTVPSGKIIALTINISGVKSDGSAVAHYLRQYALKNVSGTTSEVYAPVTIGTDNAAGTSINITANDTNDALRVEVTGIASETWRWVARVDAVEIAYGT